MTERASPRAGLLCFGGGIAALALLALPWHARAVPSETVQVLTKGLAALGAVVLLLLAQWRPLRSQARWLRGLAVLVALVSYYNFGHFHGGSFASPHEMFHYHLGSKYFPELGYDGLYLASLAAESEARPERPLPARVRDLVTNRLVPTRSLASARSEVRRRFAPERWADFVADHGYFLGIRAPAWLDRIRLDHGYNPTPAWTFVGRLFGAALPTSAPALTFLASLDLVLLGVAFAFVIRTWGVPAGCLAAVIFGTGYAWRFAFVGGAFLRMDWLAACVIGICLLKRSQPAAAGALFGYAAAVRGFPVLLLLGPAVVALRTLWRGQRPTWVLPLLGGLGAALLLAAGAGSLTGRGFAAWPEFVRDVRVHQGLAPPNRVGLENVVRNAPALLGAGDHVFLRELRPWRERDVERLRAERRGISNALSAGLLVLLLAALWQAELAESAVLSIVAIFVLTPVGCYYWILLLVVAFRSPRAAFAILGLGLAMKGVHLVYPGDTMRYALMSVALAGFFVVWLWPAALRTLREAIPRLREATS